MRLILKLKPLHNGAYSSINPKDIQGLIYNYLKGTDFETLHDYRGFKFFNFSNIFPIGDFKEDEEKNLIISSPIPDFIKILYERIPEDIRLGDIYFSIEERKKFKPKLNHLWISATPIALHWEKAKYFSFKEGGTFIDFLNLLNKNSIEKYKAFFNRDIKNPGFIKRAKFKKEVAVPIIVNGVKEIVIGSVWEFKINLKNKKYLRFLLDTGLGVRNSYGFGFINTIIKRKISFE